MKFWTDYPIEKLGDHAFEDAPIREVKIISYDGNKYCKCKISGVIEEIKSGYIYTKPGRYAEVPCITDDQLDMFDITLIESLEDIKNKLIEVEQKLAKRLRLRARQKPFVRQILFILDAKNKLVEDELVAEWHDCYSSYMDKLRNG
jgi:hypothetical protein